MIASGKSPNDENLFLKPNFVPDSFCAKCRIPFASYTKLMKHMRITHEERLNADDSCRSQKRKYKKRGSKARKRSFDRQSEEEEVVDIDRIADDGDVAGNGSDTDSVPESAKQEQIFQPPRAEIRISRLFALERYRVKEHKAQEEALYLQNAEKKTKSFGECFDLALDKFGISESPAPIVAVEPAQSVNALTEGFSADIDLTDLN